MTATTRGTVSIATDKHSEFSQVFYDTLQMSDMAQSVILLLGLVYLASHYKRPTEHHGEFRGETDDVNRHKHDGQQPIGDEFATGNNAHGRGEWPEVRELITM